METKHTKGKWEVTNRTPNGISALKGCYGIDNPDWTIACVFNDFDNQQAVANAKLISAAPELLEVLMEIKLSIDGGGDIVTFMPHDIDRINNIIKKAIE